MGSITTISHEGYKVYNLYVNQIKSVSTCGIQSVQSDGGSGGNFQQPALSWSDKTSEPLIQLDSFSYKPEKTQLDLAETRKANTVANSLRSTATKNLCSFSLSALHPTVLILF